MCIVLINCKKRFEYKRLSGNMSSKRLKITHFFKKVGEGEPEGNDGQKPSSSKQGEPEICVSDEEKTVASGKGEPECDELEKKASSTKQEASKKVLRKFRREWLASPQYQSWLQYDEEQCKMYCKICKLSKNQGGNPFVVGSMNFQKSALDRHLCSREHKHNVLEKQSTDSMVHTIMSQLEKKETALLSALKTVYFLAENDIPTHKYGKFLEFQQFQGLDFVDQLQCGDGTTYGSDRMATEMQECIAEVVRDDIQTKLEESEFVSLLADESTDIAVLNKLVVYFRTVSDDMKAETVLGGNVDIPNGKAQTIFEEMEKLCDEKQIDNRKKIGLGSDGARVMTGHVNGVSALYKNVNPFLKNVHCIAHRLALVMAQAANQCEYLKKYQEIVGQIYWYFRTSGVRSSKLAQVQQILDSPQLKLKEIHGVRWFSFYAALNAIYECWDAICTTLEEAADNKDSTAKGLLKKITTVQFLGVTSVLMDVIPTMTSINLLFQKRDLDLCLVYPTLDTAVQELKKLETENGYHLGQFVHDIGEKCQVYKNIHISDTPQLRSSIFTTRTAFSKALQDQLETRFPQSSVDLIKAFSVLGMRGIRFVPTAERGS